MMPVAKRIWRIRPPKAACVYAINRQGAAAGNDRQERPRPDPEARSGPGTRGDGFDVAVSEVRAAGGAGLDRGRLGIERGERVATVAHKLDDVAGALWDRMHVRCPAAHGAVGYAKIAREGGTDREGRPHAESLDHDPAEAATRTL
jgi:hypothetical protein